MATRAKKVAARKTIRHSDTAPEAAQAAQIALVLMSVAKSPNWAGVEASEDITKKVALTEHQQHLLEKHRGILPYLTRGGREGTLRSVVVCSHCQRVMFTSTGSAPARCAMTLGCAGTPVKARSTQEPLKDAQATTSS